MIAKEWKVIEKDSIYEISNHGEVRNKTRNTILKSTNTSGYLTITLRINKKKVISKIHRLVATSFLICLDESFIVNHKDGNKINNNVDNLEWISYSENTKHAFLLGLNKGKKNKVSQYTLNNIFIKEYDSPIDAEKETGILRENITHACRGARSSKTSGGYIWKYPDSYTATQQVPVGKIMNGYPMYIITKDGKVYNSHRKRFLIIKKHVNGYSGIALTSDDKKRVNFYIHRLVALLFIDNPHNYPEVNHIDFDKSNNIVTNLEWVTSSDNKKHNYTRVSASEL